MKNDHGHSGMPPPDLSPLLSSAHLFADPSFEFGRWGGGDKKHGVIQVPYFIRSQGAQDFVDAAYAGHWVGSDIDWSSPEAQERYTRFSSDHNEIDTAGIDKLAQMLTTVIRGDRFNEGLLASSYSSGMLGRILARVVALTDDAAGQ